MPGCFAERRRERAELSRSISVGDASNQSGVTAMNREQLIEKVKAFLKDEEGLTMVEYAVAGGLVTAAAVTAFTTLGGAIVTRINTLITAMGGTPAG
ncbi:conserved hypothetical protein [Ricinus communis]|uniref:Flp pilus assembly protein, pilin Flp n=1 Tax=Ricinus communis TaxID=3988 RepID=B9TG61_RICCO|nr:conserved hypothetical protein [Ricinus communis]